MHHLVNGDDDVDGLVGVRLTLNDRRDVLVDLRKLKVPKETSGDRQSAKSYRSNLNHDATHVVDNMLLDSRAD